MNIVDAVKKLRAEEQEKFDKIMTDLVIQELRSGFPLILTIRPLYHHKELVNIARFMTEEPIYKDVVDRHSTIRINDPRYSFIYREITHRIVDGYDPLHEDSDKSIETLLDGYQFKSTSQSVVLEMAKRVLDRARLSTKACDEAYRDIALGRFHDCWMNSLKQMTIMYMER